MIMVLAIMVMTALSCAMLGPVVILKKMAMSADALSHSTLLGLVIGYLFVRTMDSVYLIVFATIFGLLTLFISQMFSKSSIFSLQDTMGMIYPLFFAIAVILISRYLRNSMLNVETVLMGNPLFAAMVFVGPWNKALLLNGIAFTVNSIYVISQYETLKLYLFDVNMAKQIGVPISFHTHVIEFCLCLTCVCAFESVGAILVTSYLVCSAAIAQLFVKHFNVMIILSLLLSVLITLFAFYLALILNVSISGMTSFLGMVLTILIIVYHSLKKKNIM